jgi:hypothetical protein
VLGGRISDPEIEERCEIGMLGVKGEVWVGKVYTWDHGRGWEGWDRIDGRWSQKEFGDETERNKREANSNEKQTRRTV